VQNRFRCSAALANNSGLLRHNKAIQKLLNAAIFLAMGLAVAAMTAMLHIPPARLEPPCELFIFQ
jgi:hypothetical protein